MKIIGTVVLVLIAGISRSANAQYRTHAARSWCRDNAGPIQDFENCYTPVIRELYEVRDGPGGVDAAVVAFCGKTDIFDSCFRNFGRSSKLCLGSNLHEFMDLVTNVSTSAVGFPCAYPQLMKDMFNNTDHNCFGSKLEAMSTCQNNFVEEFVTMIPEAGFYGIQMCSNILTYEDCSVRLMAECADKIFSQALDTMFKYINNDIPCGNLPKLPKPESSTSGSVVIGG